MGSNNIPGRKVRKIMEVYIVNLKILFSKNEIFKHNLHFSQRLQKLGKCFSQEMFVTLLYLF